MGEQWSTLLRSLPGYDPFRTPGDSWFDAGIAQAALDFIGDCIRHVEGDLAGQLLRLEVWQAAFVANLFGWQRLDRKGRQVRRFREALLYVARKNGKTPLAAAIALLVTFTDDEAGQQNYIAACDRETAGKLFRQVKGMVDREPELKSRCDIYGGAATAGQARSLVKQDNSFLQILSADAETKHGGNPHLILIDELHTQPNRDLVDVLSTSMASDNRKQPLLIHLTTADHEGPSICNEKHDYACKVRDGVIDDLTFLPAVYEVRKDEDWKDRANWIKANPNLGVSVSEEYLERESKKAEENPAYELTFRRLHLNQKTETASLVISLEAWDRCGTLAIDEDELQGRECFAGLDLSTTTDLTAFALLFPGEEGYSLILRLWAPREGARLRSKRDRVPYEAWAREGWITLTDGDVIDYDVIRRDINRDAERYQIREIAADRWNATQILTQLQGDGFNVVAFGQGFQSMTAPTKELLALVSGRKLNHGGNPVLRWMASVLAVEKDAAENLKPSKKKSTERIDGMVALIMALGRAMLAPTGDNFGGCEAW